MAEIKIDIDLEKKAIKKIDIPEDISLLEIVKIFSGISNNFVNQLKQGAEPKEDIIKPVKNRIITPTKG